MDLEENKTDEKEHEYTLKAHAYISKAVKELENLECKCTKQGLCGRCIAITNLNGINKFLR